MNSGDLSQRMKITSSVRLRILTKYHARQSCLKYWDQYHPRISSKARAKAPLKCNLTQTSKVDSSRTYQVQFQALKDASSFRIMTKMLTVVKTGLSRRASLRRSLTSLEHLPPRLIKILALTSRDAKHSKEWSQVETARSIRLQAIILLETILFNSS